MFEESSTKMSCKSLYGTAIIVFRMSAINERIEGLFKLSLFSLHCLHMPQ